MSLGIRVLAILLIFAGVYSAPACIGQVVSHERADPPSRPEPTPARHGEIAETRVIPVKILVDEEEPATQRVWEERTRKRLRAASDMLEQLCQIKLEIVDVGTWQSDDTIAGFRAMLADFEKKVMPSPGRLAIGFTSQLLNSTECPQVGGTRGALHSHILIREWFGRTEPERLEVLVHELGHYLGAAHSAEPDSVMRPKLGDGKAVSRKFRIGFDTHNTRIMSIFAEQIRSRDLNRLQDLRAETREQLRGVYSELAQKLPNDPVAVEYVKRLSGNTSRNVPTPRTEATRLIVAAIVEAGEQQLAKASGGVEAPLIGDKLTEFYFRRAASCAAQLPREHAVPAYLLALAIGLDSSDLIRNSEWTRQFWEMVESDAERRHRIDVLGLPTMQNRPDLLQHFMASCAICVLAGPQISEAAGLLKEINDANRDSGFSFADLAADLAGISFATHLQAEPTQLLHLAESFTVADYTLPVAGLREGLSREQLQADFGSPSDPRFLAERAEILKRIRSLPGLMVKREE
jgi:hypothetical protein